MAFDLERINSFSLHRIRGLLGSFMIFAANFGVLVEFIAGAYVPYNLVPFIFVPLPIVAVIFSFYFPETPMYLARKNRYLVNS